jgi:DUF4097 and DUF4098 domain-containing protein YvlB
MRIATITALGVCLCRPALAAEFERDIAAEQLRQVTVAVASADVVVTGWKEKKLRVEADDDPGVKVDGKSVAIGSFDADHPPDTPDRAAEWAGKATEIAVRMPADVALTVRTLAGDVVVEALAGRVRLAVVSGDLRVEGCSGTVDVEAVSGDIQIVDLTADLSAQAVGGDVEVRGFEALVLEAESVSGSVTVRESEARTVRISSHSGDLLYAGRTPADGSVELTSFSGDAVVRVPEGSGFEVDASTSSGEVSLGVDAEISEKTQRRLRARTSQPGPRLRLKSFSGSVAVERL